MLNDRQKAIAAEIVAGERPITQIMESNGFNRGTYYLWKKSPEFCEYMEQLQSEQRDAAVQILRAASSKAAKVLVNALGGTERINRTRLDAAKAILDRIGIIPAKEVSKEDERQPVTLTIEEIRSRLQEKQESDEEADKPIHAVK